MHEQKNCPRCGALFTCKPGNITQCQCYGIVLSDKAQDTIAVQYDECLCRRCLEELAAVYPDPDESS